MPDVSGPASLEFVRVSKRYGANLANRDISLTLRRGEIHAVVGENGAGKSTLMSMASGLTLPDSGEIRIDGRAVALRSPRDALALGVGMVHQHFLLVETLSVLDNLLLGAEGGVVLSRGRAAMRARLADIMRAHGLTIDPQARVGDLSLGARQRVEILKALTRGARILILDEPTAVLTPAETQALFGLMRSLAESGVAIVFITHKLGEALAIADRVSVLRAGALVATFDAAGLDAATLAEAMVGRPIEAPRARTARAPGDVILAARGLSARDAAGRMALADLSLEVRAGEIVGVAGVAGNGQSELLEILAGLRRPLGGELDVGAVRVDFARYDPACARALGLAHVPEDRQARAMIAAFPADENAMLGRQRDPRFGRRLLDPAAIARQCADLMARWDVRPPQPRLPLGRFSGGNQQKLVFAREAETDPRALLVGQPTRGVDIVASEAIHRRLLDLRDAGKAILLVSSELDEILALSDRVVVMHAGRIVGERAPDQPGARRDIGLMMAGGRENAA